MNRLVDSISTGLHRVFQSEAVHHCEIQGSTQVSALHPSEANYIAGNSGRRVQEFQLGRHCARVALSKLDCRGSPILADRNGCPIWPTGYVGSISNKNSIAVAVTGKRNRLVSIGVDLETLDATDESLLERVCTRSELAQIGSLGNVKNAHAGTLFFCAKEAVFKCIYPLLLTREIGFGDIELTFTNSSFEARLVGSSFVLPADFRILGNTSVESGFLIAGSIIYNDIK